MTPLRGRGSPGISPTNARPPKCSAMVQVAATPAGPLCVESVLTMGSMSFA